MALETANQPSSELIAGSSVVPDSTKADETTLEHGLKASVHNSELTAMKASPEAAANPETQVAVSKPPVELPGVNSATDDQKPQV